jgi:hypothetical protein
MTSAAGRARRDLRLVDAAVAAWAIAWAVAAVVTVSSVRQLGEVGDTAVTVADGLDESSAGLRRASRGLRQTGDALAAIGSLPLIGTSLGDGVRDTADELDGIAERVEDAAAEARLAARDADESVGVLAVVLGLAVGLGPVLPLVACYLLVRPLVRARLEARA